MRALPLALFIGASASSAVAEKYRVVVLEIDGDRSDKLRSQIESTLRNDGAVEIVPLDKFRLAAAKKRLNGSAAMTVIGVKRVGTQLKLDAAVSGEVGKKFKVLLYDRVGGELWTKELPVKKGLLSADFAQKLARAIAAAAEQGAAKNSKDAGETPEPDTGEQAAASPSPEIDLTGKDNDKTDRAVVVPSQSRTDSPDSDPGNDVNRDADLDSEALRKKNRVGPRTISVSISAASTWRSQCLRPGSTAIASCVDFDRLAESQQPVGTKINLSPLVPYFGLTAYVDLFPFASFENRFVNGFGLLSSVVFGSSVIIVSEQNAQGTTEDKQVTSVDLGWSMQAAWRYHFTMGAGEPQGIGFVGLRGGLVSRTFTIDPNAGVPLPSSQRVAPTGAGFPAIGADLAFPIVRFLRLELGASWFFNPITAPEQIVGFGNLMDDTGGALSTGWGVEVGGSGDLVALGPAMFGWTLKFRSLSFFDRYYGQGQKWTVCNETQCGGLGEESYLSVTAGVSFAY
jgi:hypothetical protein